MRDYLTTWKIEKGYYDQDGLTYEDEVCDYLETVKRGWESEMREWTPYRLRQLFGVKTASSRHESDDKKEAVRERADVGAILQAVGIPFRQVGDNLMFRCPFHDDSRPSCSFSRSKKVWYCHVCVEGGDVFRFIERFYDCSFGEAVDKAAC